ncbi:MAG: hypothetical protein KGL39_08680 [Patescibacteria group bacterium]|nr:hypothetical protein [Patescibacteria group bacterium]
MSELEPQNQGNQTVDDANLEAELAQIPEKLRGKTPADLIRMYQEVERERSRLGNELGDSRRMIDRLLEVQPKIEEPKKEPRPEITPDDLFADPNKALDLAISTHPSVEKIQQANEELERRIAQRTFEQEYPSYKEDINDPTFVEWVKKNPVRTNLILEANGYNLNSARALWGMWSEYKELTGQKSQRESAEIQRRQREKDGTLEGASGAQVNAEPRLNRAELRDLQRRALLGDKTAIAKWNDPKFQEIRKAAYADGRVD